MAKNYKNDYPRYKRIIDATEGFLKLVGQESYKGLVEHIALLKMKSTGETDDPYLK